MPESFVATPERPVPSARLSRAATYALGAAIATGTAILPGCGPTHVVDHGAQVDIYGGPPEPPDPSPAQPRPTPPPLQQETQPPSEPLSPGQAYGTPPPDAPPPPAPPDHHHTSKVHRPPDHGEMTPMYGLPPEDE